MPALAHALVAALLALRARLDAFELGGVRGLEPCDGPAAYGKLFARAGSRLSRWAIGSGCSAPRT